MISVIYLGDVVGEPGRTILRQELPTLRERYSADLVLVNGENSAGGLGIVPEVVTELQESGVDLISLGDHAFQRSAMLAHFDRKALRCTRPANYPEGAPGAKVLVHTVNGVRLGLVNLLGRVFFNTALDCPFRAIDDLLKSELAECDLVICDLHAEATSEKVGFGHYVDGRVALVVGTHTHVQTADEQILPGGTGYISDLGMCGSFAGVLGMNKEVALQRLVSGMPASYKVSSGMLGVNGVAAQLDPTTGRTISIERIRIIHS